ncbi:MAG: hypothetical protein K2P20_02380 [Oscillospiraceae bacterium]|nr:hypothetical protein [Oscillospiraceae bacterium]
MGSLKTDGIDSLSLDLSELAYLPDRVVADMLQAEADVILSAQRSEIESRWKGPYSLGISAKSIRKGSVKKGKDGYSISIYPQGSRKRGKKTVRNAEIAFINEYGAPKRNIRARPALKSAIARKEDEAAAAGKKVYQAYLDSKNL